ncbi:hypothetical protein [Micromonospora sp. NPDC051296]|uniref:hypothetical protein n=1 Tax=Micromonospora sp. NPDC051296 TaxID=3155046 RepID=UPI0034145C9C
MRIVRETGKPIAQVALDLGINDGTLACRSVSAYQASRPPSTSSTARSRPP